VIYCCTAVSSGGPCGAFGCRAVSLECNQVFGTRLAVVEDDEHVGVGHPVHHAVVQLNEAGALGRRSDHAALSDGEIPRQHSTEVHAPLPIWLGLGVGGLGRVVGVDGKVCAVAETHS